LKKGRVKGMSIIAAGLIITAEMSGTGILALPAALSQSHWFGVAMIIGSCMLSFYCGIRLSSCWEMIRKKDITLQKKYRGDPYQLIGYKAAGNFGK
jgi:solute carrier family 32 (vesicular inhibitory amino acid transporter)